MSKRGGHLRLPSGLSLMEKVDVPARTHALGRYFGCVLVCTGDGGFNDKDINVWERGQHSIQTPSQTTKGEIH